MKSTLPEVFSNYDQRIASIETFLGFATMPKVKTVKRAISAKKGKRLTPEAKEQLKQDLLEGSISLKAIAAKYNVSMNTVYMTRSKLNH